MGLQSLLSIFSIWAWGDNPNPDVSPDICLANLLPVPPVACIVALAAKAIGLAIIAGAFLNKAPVIANVLSNKSVAGMSPAAIYTETIMYANAALYSFLRGNPFTSWGESGILSFQSLGLCFLLWKFKDDPKVSRSEQLAVLAGYALYLFISLTILPPDLYYLLLTMNWPALLFSRGTQIWTFYKCQHTGTQSIITTFMNFIGSVLRFFTTISEVGYDWALLSGYLISCGLNAALLSQFIMYKNGTEKYMKNLAEKKKD